MNDCPAYAGGQTPALQAGAVSAHWALFCSHSNGFVSETLNTDHHGVRALLPLQHALAAHRASQLQNCQIYARLLIDLLDCCINLWYKSVVHAIPFEGVVDTAAEVQRLVPHRDFTKFEMYVLSAGLKSCNKSLSGRSAHELLLLNHVICP